MIKNTIQSRLPLRFKLIAFVRLRTNDSYYISVFIRYIKRNVIRILYTVVFLYFHGHVIFDLQKWKSNSLCNGTWCSLQSLSVDTVFVYNV